MSNMEEIQKKQARCGCRAKQDATAVSPSSTAASGDALPCGETICDPLEATEKRRIAIEAARDELEAAAVAYADPRHRKTGVRVDDWLPVVTRLRNAVANLEKLRKGDE